MPNIAHRLPPGTIFEHNGVVYYVINPDKEGEFILVGNMKGRTVDFDPKREVNVLATSVEIAKRICDLAAYDARVIRELFKMMATPIPGAETGDAFNMALQQTSATLLVVNRQLQQQLALLSADLDATRKALADERKLLERFGLDALLRLHMSRSRL